VACWSTKAAISLKRVKIDEMLPWRAYRKSPTIFGTVPLPTPYGLLCPKIGVCNPHPKLQSLLPGISGTGKATDFKSGQYIHRIHPNKSPLKFSRKGSMGVSRDCPNFWGRLPPIISGAGKGMNFQFCRHIYRLNRNKRLL